jgi:hypothetical protein
MASVATFSERADSPAPGLALFATGAWAIFAVLTSLHLVTHPGALLLSTDDAMRLAQMRDLMGGQSWFDTTQARMNAPFGLEMHWPHFVDAAIASLVIMLRPLLGGHAEAAAIRLWPLLTALPVFLASARIANRLGGREAGIVALVLTATCFSTLAVFVPGRIDHHNVQLALGLWMAACLVETERPWLFALAAVLGVFSIAIGLETLPYVAMAALFATGLCALGEGQFDRQVRGFGLAFTASAALLFAIAPSAEQHAAACDAYSLFYAPLAVAGGLGLSALTYLPRNRALRCGAAVVLAAGLLALAFGVNRVCLGGPYAEVNPALDALWLSRVEEAQPVWRFAFLEPDVFIAGYLYAAACFAATCTMLALSGKARLDLLALALLAGTALAVATLEIRGVPFAGLFGLPGLAVLVVYSLRRIEALNRARVLQACLAAAVLFGASDVSFDVAGKFLQPQKATPKQNAALCYQRQTLSALDALPPGNMAAFVDQGPGILAYTRHAVVAGPYHRDVVGILDTNTIFAGPPAEAARVISRRKIDYVAVCSVSPDYPLYLEENRQGLLAGLARGSVPNWLKPATLPDPQHVLSLYRVVR